MNPFDYFQKLRSEREDDNSFMEKLREFAFGDKVLMVAEQKLDFRGGGKHTKTYRIGMVGDLWIAAREFNYIGQDEEELRLQCESYIHYAVREHGIGNKVPAFCGGLVAKNGYTEYFVLVEDLTNGGKFEIQSVGSGEKYGIVNGEKVYFDFDEFRFWEFKKEPEYMTDDKIITLTQ
jgi:hypothetical protein